MTDRSTGDARTPASPAELGLDPDALDALYARAERTAARHPLAACQVAIARHGRLAGLRTFGRARFGEAGERDADDGTLFSGFSITKAIVSAACWILLEEGKLALSDRAAEIVPGFGDNGKQDVDVLQLLTHTSGFPNARLDPVIWPDAERRLARFRAWPIEWAPGSRFVYHGTSSMWVLAEVIERRTGQDFRDFIRGRILDPLGLADLHLGLPRQENPRVADVGFVGEPPTRSGSVEAPSIAESDMPRYNTAEVRAIGAPGGGIIASAADIALFYQGLLMDARGEGAGIWRAETLADAWTIRNPEFIDPMTRQPALRGLGVVMAGEEGRFWRGFANSCSAASFGHMGAGGQIAWADPESGLSFAFLTTAYERDPARQGGNGMKLSTLATECVK
jgi:CubicO group peptidase (beta-lactamase class C family)